MDFPIPSFRAINKVYQACLEISHHVGKRVVNMESQQKSFFELFAKRAFFKLGESQQATEGKALFLIDKERFHSIKNFRKIY